MKSYNAPDGKGYPFNYIFHILERHNQFAENTKFKLIQGHFHYEDVCKIPDLAATYEYILTTCPRTRARAVLEGRYRDGKTRQEVGEMLGVSRERIFQIEHQIERHFENHIRLLCLGVDGYVDEKVDEAYAHGENVGKEKGRKEVLKEIHEREQKETQLAEAELAQMRDSVMKRSVEEVLAEADASIRVYNAVTKCEDIITVEDLVNRYDEKSQSWDIRAMGRKSNFELKGVLRRYGIVLPGRYT